MAMVSFIPAPPKCRRITVPACDPEVASAGINPPSVGGEMILVKVGDIIDVGLDWSQWLEVNAGKLGSSLWSAHASSPQVPTFTGDLEMIDPHKHETPVVLDLTAALPGHVYYLRNTVIIQGVPNAAGFALPSRALVRVLHVKVSA